MCHRTARCISRSILTVRQPYFSLLHESEALNLTRYSLVLECCIQHDSAGTYLFPAAFHIGDIGSPAQRISPPIGQQTEALSVRGNAARVVHKHDNYLLILVDVCLCAL